MAEKFTFIKALRAFAILSSTAIGAGHEFARAKSRKSPGGVEVTKSERTKILAAGLRAGMDQAFEKTGVDLFPAFQSLVKAGRTVKTEEAA